MTSGARAPQPGAPETQDASQAPLRVTLVDDDELTTRGLTAMLRACPGQIELVGLSQPLTEPVDIALYDPASSRGASIPTLAQLVADTRIRKVALFTWNFRTWAAAGLIGQGAAAYLSKGLTTAELVHALHGLNSNPGLVAPAAGSDRAPGTWAERGDALTTREAEVLSLICRGLSNAEAAATLHLSPNSVKSYIRSCYRKIEVDSRSKAVLWGLSHGFGGSPLPSGPPVGTPGRTTPATDARRSEAARIVR